MCCADVSIVAIRMDNRGCKHYAAVFMPFSPAVNSESDHA